MGVGLGLAYSGHMIGNSYLNYNDNPLDGLNARPYHAFHA